MKLQMHSVHFTADQKLTDYVQRRADKLETFYDRIMSGEVFLRLEKDTSNKENKVVEIKLFVPGGSLFVKEQHSTFEAATDIAVEAMKSQLKRHKEKNHPIHTPTAEEAVPIVAEADADEDGF